MLAVKNNVEVYLLNHIFVIKGSFKIGSKKGNPKSFKNQTENDK